ncbi:Unknown protein, partial [Striga hermonthica]
SRRAATSNNPRPPQTSPTRPPSLRARPSPAPFFDEPLQPSSSTRRPTHSTRPGSSSSRQPPFLASFNRDAGLWWHSYWEMRPGEKLALTWAGLKALLREKYYPAHYRERMERQFLALEQGARTVDEYERDFTRLGFFVPYLIDTEETRARRFRGGLRGEIRHHLAGLGALTYAETVSRAQQIDESLRLEAIRTRAARQPAHQPPAQQPAQQAPPQLAPPQQPQRQNKRRGRDRQGRRVRQRDQAPAQAVQPVQQIAPAYATCGRHHTGECLAGRGICFHCHRPGHLRGDCPDRAQRQQGQRQPAPNQPRGAPARVYALDQAQAAEQPGTMSGMISLFDVPIFALFDTGATHSFVSAKCLEAIGVRGVSAVDPIEISLASGRKIVTSSLAEGLSMSIGGRTLEVDAFVIEMRDFDLILGMD